MALQTNPFTLKKQAYNRNIKYQSNSINHNLNKNITLPLTIIPLTEDALIKQQQQQLMNASAAKPPDLTFHCMCCEEYFVNPFHMYEHLNTKHADLPESQLSEEDLEDGKDYSWVFEPVCELMADEQEAAKENTNNNEDASSSSSSDSDSDDDDSSSTSSSSNSSTSSASSSNANSNIQDEATRDAIVVKHLEMPNTNRTTEIKKEPAFGELEAVSMQSDNFMPNIKLEPLDESQDNPPMLVINPAANTIITPVLPQIRRGRGRRSAAQQAAIEMSSIISGEPKCFQCSHCEASFPSAGDLSKHVRCHITNKPFQCSICDKTFTHIGSLNTHIRIHSGEKPYKCELCSKAFTQSSSLMVHIRSHSIKKPHQCHLCDKGFVNFTSLAIHLKTHNEAGVIFNCPECDKTFKQESQLQEHMRMHTLSLVYQCSICRQAFASSSELVQHMKCHMGEKPFTCSICDRSFTQSGSLNIHMRIHTGEKPFNCKFCNKSFTQASSLSVHLKIHSGDKPFPCHICGKSYSQSAYLNKHIQNHFEEQKVKKEQNGETLLCIVCGELHRDANSLAMHVTQKHAALLNNMQGQINNSSNMEISEEERLKQEQMYMQQIRMLMQMQQHVVKRPMSELRETVPAEINNVNEIRNPSVEMADDELANDDFEEEEENNQERHSDQTGQHMETLEHIVPPQECFKNGITKNIQNGNKISSVLSKENRSQSKNIQQNGNIKFIQSSESFLNTQSQNSLEFQPNPPASNHLPPASNEDFNRMSNGACKEQLPLEYRKETTQHSHSNERYQNHNHSPLPCNTNSKEFNGKELYQHRTEQQQEFENDMDHENCSNESQPIYERENELNSPASNRDMTSNGKELYQHRTEQLQEFGNYMDHENCSNESQPIYERENELNSPASNRDMTSNFNGINHMSYNESIEEGERESPIQVNRNETPLQNENSQTISIYQTNSQQHSDENSHSPVPMPIAVNHSEMSSNHNVYNSEDSQEYQQDFEQISNINYGGVIRQHRTVVNHNEYHSEPDYDNDNGVDMDVMQQDLNGAIYSDDHNDNDNDDDDLATDINGDIEMSDYPFVDDTKFNFYDDYAAEEEVETAE